MVEVGAPAVAVVVVAVAAAVAGDHEAVGRAVVGAGMAEERRGSDCSMTGGSGVVSWVDQWLWVADGPDVLDLMRSWAGERVVHVSR